MQMLKRNAVIEAIPTTWLDPLLTGPAKVLPDSYSFTPKDVERLLLAIKTRLSNIPVAKKRN